ncbi:hypothetical protein [Streptomyces sp. NPDC054784]
MADTTWVLTPDTYRAVDQAADDDGVFAKGYWQFVDGKNTVVGIRIGSGEDRVVAFFGDTITRQAPGIYTVERGDGRG